MNGIESLVKAVQMLEQSLRRHLVKTPSISTIAECARPALRS
jgi:hypothetical protein